jgi:hypothetical protein
MITYNKTSPILKSESNHSQIIFMFKIRGVLYMLKDLNI